MRVFDGRIVMCTMAVAVSAAIGCAPIDGTSGDDPAACTGKCDDLGGRHLTIEPRSPAIAVEVPAPLKVPLVEGPPRAYTVRPTFKETGQYLRVSTDDLRLPLPARNDDRHWPAPETTTDVSICEGDDGLPFEGASYSFLLMWRAVNDGAWIPVEVIANNTVWNWSKARVHRDGDRVLVSGTGVAYQDRLLGLANEREQAAVGPIALDGVAELRVLAIPAWDFVEFDETGYETCVVFRHPDR